MRTWEEQRDRICELNDHCLELASEMINEESQIIKGYAKDGAPFYSTVLDGVEMLARCSAIAKQWTAEIRQSAPDPAAPKTEDVSDDSLIRKAKKA